MYEYPASSRKFTGIPSMAVSSGGRLWITWYSGVWALTTNEADVADPSWAEPKRLIDGVMMCKPIVMSSGEWVLPVSFWHIWEESAKMVVSADLGLTWEIRGAVNVPENVRNHDEHMIVERKDGSLWMLIRTRYGIGQSISNDRGKTWSPLTPSLIQHPGARFFISRLYFSEPDQGIEPGQRVLRFSGTEKLIKQGKTW